MGVESVSNTNADFDIVPSTFSESKAGGTSALGKDEFLNLLVKQTVLVVQQWPFGHSIMLTMEM